MLYLHFYPILIIDSNVLGKHLIITRLTLLVKVRQVLRWLHRVKRTSLLYSNMNYSQKYITNCTFDSFLS